MYSGEFWPRHCRPVQVRCARAKFGGDQPRGGRDTSPDHAYTQTALLYYRCNVVNSLVLVIVNEEHAFFLDYLSQSNSI